MNIVVVKETFVQPVIRQQIGTHISLHIHQQVSVMVHQ
jgi:hypothetical protein